MIEQFHMSVKSKSNLKNSLYRFFIYSIIYSSLFITFIFTIGGVLFCIPPLCQLFGIGLIGQLLIGTFCVVSSYWSSYVIQGVALRDFILKLAGLKPELHTSKQANKPGIGKYILVSSMCLGYAIFCIGSSYFGMLAILSSIGMQSSFIASVFSLVLAVINYIPTFALYGMGLFESELGLSDKSMPSKLSLTNEPVNTRPVKQSNDSNSLVLSPVLRQVNINKSMRSGGYLLRPANHNSIIISRSRSCSL